jgi:hypothetical protein
MPVEGIDAATEMHEKFGALFAYVAAYVQLRALLNNSHILLVMFSETSIPSLDGLHES